ncbi:MAG: sulfite exporter TauE/SafE family protein [Candidatus Obscuribacterales bacterium]|nr:sulfite exporter TauE/SafE family protein [Candidatus Obscuribacterales bacterium]
MIFSDAIARFAEILSIGLVSGALSGAFGIGGGIVSTPLIRHLLGIVPHVAIGSTLAVIFPTSIVGVFNYVKAGKILPMLACVTGVPAVIGTIIASYLSHYVQGQHLMLILCGLMMLIGLDILFSVRSRLVKQSDDAAEIQLGRKSYYIALICGYLVGLVSGFLGIGGGFLLVPCYCYFIGLPLKIAFGTSLAVVAIVAVPGIAVHAWHGHVDLNVVLPMLGGSIPGAWLGSYFSLKTKDKYLKMIFGSILILLSFYFFYRELV